MVLFQRPPELKMEKIFKWQLILQILANLIKHLKNVCFDDILMEF